MPMAGVLYDCTLCFFPLTAAPLLTRMFGNWTLLAGLLRMTYATLPDSLG